MALLNNWATITHSFLEPAYIYASPIKYSMTHRDFFRLLIKVVGLYFFTQILFTYLPAQLGFINSVFGDNFQIVTLIYFAFLILLVIGILYFLIRFPDKIIDLFKLDKGFDRQNISITNFNSRNIIMLGLIIIGGFLIIENVTIFISTVYYLFRKSLDSSFPVAEYSYLSFIIPALNLLVGGILLSFRKSIANYFEK